MRLYKQYYPEFMPKCDCIDMLDGTFELVCADQCERCNEDVSICGIDTTTQVIDANEIIQRFVSCFEYTEGDFDGDNLCIEDVYDEYNFNQCRISVNDVECDTCEYQERACGIQAVEGLFLTADCTNVDEIGYVVDDCTHTDYEGILSSYFTTFHHVGVCDVDGSIQFTDNSTNVDLPEVGQDRTEGVCGEEAYWMEDMYPEYQRTCSCADNADGTTTMTCTDGCESCDDKNKVCGLNSFSSTFAADDYFASQYLSCIEYTKGSFVGDLVCFEEYVDDTYMFERNWWFVDSGTCRLIVNGVDCNSCEVQEKSCGGFSGYGLMLLADCTNTDMGIVVDECDDNTYHELLEFIYNDMYAPGRCDLEQGDNTTTIPTLKPPADKPDSDNSTVVKPGDEDPGRKETSTARHDKLNTSTLAVAVVVIAVLMYS